MPVAFVPEDKANFLCGESEPCLLLAPWGCCELLLDNDVGFE